jgi:hypothetical protein
MKFEFKPFIFIILSSVCLFSFFGLAIFSDLDLGIAIKPPKTIEQVNLDAYNMEALQEGAAGIFEVDLSLAILPPSSSQEERSLTIQAIKDVHLYARNDTGTHTIKEVCINSIDLIAQGEPDVNGYFTYEIHSFLREPFCHAITENDLLLTAEFISEIVDGEEKTFLVENYYIIPLPKEDTNPYVGEYPEIIGQNFWFPFDAFSTTLNIQVSTTTYLEDGTEIQALVPAYYDWRLRPSGSRAWDIKIQNSAETLPQKHDEYMGFFMPGPYQKVELQFERPLLFRISFPILISAMVFLIALVPMMKEANTDGILGVMAGLLFATFAIRAILSPGNEIGQTLIDVGIIGLNILQIFAAGLLFVRIRRRHHEAPEMNKPGQV